MQSHSRLVELFLTNPCVFITPLYEPLEGHIVPLEDRIKGEETRETRGRGEGEEVGGGNSAGATTLPEPCFLLW